MKSVSPVIATVILLLMTVAAGGLAYITITGFQSQTQTSSEGAVQQVVAQTQSQLKIESVSGGKIYVRNIGTHPITQVKTYLQGIPFNVTCPDTLEPGRVYVCNVGEEIPPCPSGYAQIQLGSGSTSSTIRVRCEQLQLEGAPCDSDANCTSSQWCSEGRCASCSNLCDNSCQSSQCNPEDPDCDTEGNPTLVCCGDSDCESGENSLNCPQDCGAAECEPANICYPAGGPYFGWCNLTGSLNETKYSPPTGGSYCSSCSPCGDDIVNCGEVCEFNENCTVPANDYCEESNQRWYDYNLNCLFDSASRTCSSCTCVAPTGAWNSSTETGGVYCTNCTHCGDSVVNCAEVCEFNENCTVPANDYCEESNQRWYDYNNNTLYDSASKFCSSCACFVPTGVWNSSTENGGVYCTNCTHCGDTLVNCAEVCEFNANCTTPSPSCNTGNQNYTYYSTSSTCNPNCLGCTNYPSYSTCKTTGSCPTGTEPYCTNCTHCGDTVCNCAENCTSCPGDCPCTYQCCNGVCCSAGTYCSGGSCVACTNTCNGICQGSGCTSDPDCTSTPCCGNGVCDGSETCSTCLSDCGSCYLSLGGLYSASTCSGSRTNLTSGYNCLPQRYNLTATVPSGATFTSKIIQLTGTSVSPTKNSFNDTTTSKDLAFTGNQNQTVYVKLPKGLTIQSATMSLTGLQNPTLKGSYVTSSYPYGVAVSGNYAYVADGYDFVIINITNPASPTLKGSYTITFPSFANSVAVSGNYAYVAVGDGGLLIINIANPASPTLTGSYNTPGSAKDVAVSGNYAYVADSSSGLQIINIANPALPTLTGSCTVPYTAYGVAVSGNYAYVAATWGGLQIINITNPASPTIKSYCGTYFANKVAISGNYAYIADSTSGLRIINIANPALPTLIGSYDTPGSGEGVAVSGNYAYVADHSAGGLQIINITNPASPTLTGYYDTPSYAYSVAVSGSYAYVADRDSLQIIQIQTPFPYNPWLDTASSGSPYEWSYSGNLSSIQSANLNPTVINSYTSTCTPDSNGNCDMPLTIHSDGPGILRLTSLNIASSESAKLVNQTGTVLWSKTGAWSGSENVTLSDLAAGQTKNYTLTGMTGTIQVASYVTYIP